MLQISLLAAALLQAASVNSIPIQGIARAVDGDSLEIGRVRVRLFGIDAPEFDQLCTRDGARYTCGAEAADRLSKLVTGRSISCILAGVDQHQRVLARCAVSGEDVNSTMVQAGYAVAYRQYSLDYFRAEEAAKAAKRGIWAGTFDMPSEARAQARSEQSPTASVSRSPRVQASRTSVRFSGGCTIKGNRSRRGDWIYHLPGMPYYDQTRAEDIFCSERAAQAAGYRRAIVR